MNDLTIDLEESTAVLDRENPLQTLIDQLARFDQLIDVHMLKKLLADLELSEADLEPFLNFDGQNYQRNLIFRTQNFEILLLCFESGQRTPIHDHAGSACGVRVVAGTGTETAFETSLDDCLVTTGSRILPEGGVVGSVDMDIHELANLQSNGDRLVTLHVYSPPLGEVGNYSIDSDSVIQVKAAERSVR